MLRHNIQLLATKLPRARIDLARFAQKHARENEDFILITDPPSSAKAYVTGAFTLPYIFEVYVSQLNGKLDTKCDSNRRFSPSESALPGGARFPLE